jgi:hypothetical protein
VYTDPIDDAYAALGILSASDVLDVVALDTSAVRLLPLTSSVPINLGGSCTSFLGIRARTILLGRCVGLDSAAMEAYVDASTPPIVLADGATTATAVSGSGSRSANNGKYVFAFAPESGGVPGLGRLYSIDAPATPTTLEADIQTVGLTDDGQIVWIRNDATMRTAKFGGAPRTLVTGARELLGSSNTTVVYSTKRSQEGTFDLSILDFTAQTPKPIVLDFNPDGMYVSLFESPPLFVWVQGVAPESAIAGTFEGDIYARSLDPSGTSVLVATNTGPIGESTYFDTLVGTRNPRALGPAAVRDIFQLDQVSGGAPVLVAERTTLYHTSATHYVWARAGSDAGLYAKHR